MPIGLFQTEKLLTEFSSCLNVWRRGYGCWIWICLIQDEYIIIGEFWEKGAEEFGKLIGSGAPRIDEDSSFVCIEARYDGDLVPVTRLPRFDGSLGDYSSFALDYRLPWPAKTGFIFAVNFFRRSLNKGKWKSTKGGQYFF